MKLSASETRTATKMCTDGNRETLETTKLPPRKEGILILWCMHAVDQYMELKSVNQNSFIKMDKPQEKLNKLQKIMMWC